MAITEPVYDPCHHKMMSDLEFDFARFEAHLGMEEQRLRQEFADRTHWENEADRQTLDSLLSLLEKDGTPAMIETTTALHHVLTEDTKQTLAQLTLDYRRQEQCEMTARLQFIEDLSAALHTQSSSVTDLQAEILSVELLTLEERFCWASAAAQLLTEQGINLDDPRAVIEAQQLYAKRVAAELDEEDEIELLRSLGREVIAVIYADIGVYMQDDLDAQTTDLLMLITHMNGAPQMLRNIYIKGLYERAEIMGWSDPEKQVDRIITALKGLRSFLEAAK